MLVRRRAFGIVRCQVFSIFCFVTEVYEPSVNGDGDCCMISVALILYVCKSFDTLKLTVEAEHEKPKR